MYKNVKQMTESELMSELLELDILRKYLLANLGPMEIANDL